VVGRLRTRCSGIALAGLCATALVGCAGSQDGAVRDVAEEFYAAVARGDGEGACALLAPSTRAELEQSSGRECAAAVQEEVPAAGGDSGVVEVYGTMAEVRFDGDTAFFAQMPGGWRVVAAGCRPREDGPYDCAVKGA
jgi:hypothetical protein